MTARHRLLTLVVLAGLLLTVAAPAVALAHGPGSRGMARAAMRGRGADPMPGPGHGRHHGSRGGYGMLRAFASALRMSPWELIREIETGNTIADLARARGIDPEELVRDVVEEMTEWMAYCLQAGHMTQEQYTWMHDQIEEHVRWLLENSQVLLYEWRHGSVFGPGWGYGYGGLIWAAAEVLELSPWEIHEALHEGATIAELAGYDEAVIDEIVNAFMAPRIEALNAAVAAGELTQEQADWLRTHIEAHARWLIENTPPMGAFGHGGGGGCH